jgi:predicted transposase YbfD/YdcC
VFPGIQVVHAIENSLHWVMDMVFPDDECRIRPGNAPANFATCRHIVYNLTLPGKDSSRLRRKTAGCGDEYLAKIIAA